MSKNKHKNHEEENHERWLVSYADFITLLFAFFVVMYATSNNDEEKQKSFEESVRVELRLGTGGGSGSSGSGAGSQEVSREAILAEAIGGAAERFPTTGSPEEVRDFIQRQIRRRQMSEKENEGVSVRHDAVGARISLAASSFFPSGSARILRESYPALDAIAEVIKLNNRKILIEGHTDDIPFQRGEIMSNWELASMRATSVLRYFIKVHDIQPHRLAAISYADQKPIVPNQDENSRQKNRRVEILLLGSEE